MCKSFDLCIYINLNKLYNLIATPAPLARVAFCYLLFYLERCFMRKILSLILSVVILLCTLSVLTVLPVVATTTPANLIINGDAESGNWTADTFKDSNYANIGLIMGANKSFHNCGWYATNDWGEAAAINLSSNANRL